MNAQLTLQRLRAFLRALAAALFAGAVVELLLVGHTDGLIQLAPFGLCGLGLLALAAVWRQPGRRTLLAARAIMAVIAAGSLVGVGVHLTGNLEVIRETQPAAGAARQLAAALSGAAPLLAPGILALAAALTVAATHTAGGMETKPASVTGEEWAAAGAVGQTPGVIEDSGGGRLSRQAD